MALIRTIFLSSLFFTTLLWLIFLGKLALDNLKKERDLLISLNKEMVSLRSEMTLFKEEIDNLKKKIVDKSHS